MARCSSERHPNLAAARRQRPGDLFGTAVPPNRSSHPWPAVTGRRSSSSFRTCSPVRLGAPCFVDYFGVLPRDLAPLLSWPGQAVFLVPTAQFRRVALTRRYTDPVHAFANWGDLDPATALEARLARDALWDAEVIEQAEENSGCRCSRSTAAARSTTSQRNSRTVSDSTPNSPLTLDRRISAES